MICKLQIYILCNIVIKIVVIIVKNIKKLKNYLHRGSCASCGKLLIRKTLSIVKNIFKGAHNLNCEIS